MLSFNPHHKRAYVRVQGAASMLRKALIELVSDPSNTSKENEDKLNQAYILVEDVVGDLEARKINHNHSAAARRVAGKAGDTDGTE